MKRKMISAMLVITMTFSMIACGSSDKDIKTADSPSAAEDTTASDDSSASEGSAADVSDLKVGIVMKSSDEFQNAVVRGATEAAVEAGVSESNIKAVASTSESDSMQQVTAIEDMISNGTNILLCACQEENALKGVLGQAADAGIKVVMVDTDCASFESKVTFIGTDNYQAAYDGALEFAKRLEKGSNVVILRGKLGDVNHESRTEGLKTALEESGMNVLEVQDANCETDKAANTMESFLSKYPDQINAVMVTSDSMAVGAAQAIESAGAGGIKICGFDGFQSAIELIESGEIEMIIGQKPYEMGSEGFACGLGALNGETYDSYINPGIQVIDSENYKNFLG